MKKVIEKKIKPEYFQLILDGKKKFELRLDEFEIEEGDTLLLREYEDEKYTGREIQKDVLYVRNLKVQNLHWPIEEVMKKGLKIISFN